MKIETRLREIRKKTKQRRTHLSNGWGENEERNKQEKRDRSRERKHGCFSLIGLGAKERERG